MLYTAHYDSPVGKLILAAKDSSLFGLWIEGQKYCLESATEDMEARDTPVLYAVEKWLDRYFAGKKPDASELELAPEGTAFQKQVWHLLLEIPYGSVLSYGELAKRAARPGQGRISAQAAGGAVGHNHILIIIPCHRVIGSDGSLTGYAAGLAAKAKLLELEGYRNAGIRV